MRPPTLPSGRMVLFIKKASFLKLRAHGIDHTLLQVLNPKNIEEIAVFTNLCIVGNASALP